MIFFVSLHKNSLQTSKMIEINQYRQELKDRIISYAMPEFYKRGVKAVKMEEIMHHQLYRVHSMQEIYDNYILCLIRGFCTERGLEQLDRALKE